MADIFKKLTAMGMSPEDGASLRQELAAIFRAIAVSDKDTTNKEHPEFESDFKIENRGTGTCVVFKLKSPYQEIGSGRTITEAVFNEKSLRDRITNIERDGRDTFLEKIALYVVR